MLSKHVAFCLVLLYKALLEPLKEMVQRVLGVQKLDYIVFSHVEADESGAINKWLEIYPEAKVVCNKVANINLEDFLIRPAQVLKDNDILPLGTNALQLISTTYVQHNWDAHMWLHALR